MIDWSVGSTAAYVLTSASSSPKHDVALHRESLGPIILVHQKIRPRRLPIELPDEKGAFLQHC